MIFMSNTKGSQNVIFDFLSWLRKIIHHPSYGQLKNFGDLKQT